MLCRRRWTSMHGKRTDIAAYVRLACVEGIAAYVLPVCADGNAVYALPCLRGRQYGVCPFSYLRRRQCGVARWEGEKLPENRLSGRRHHGRGGKRRSGGAAFPVPSTMGCRVYCKMAGQYGHVYRKMNGQYAAVRFLRGWLRGHRQRLSCSPALRRCCGDRAVLIICATCLSALSPPVGMLFARRCSICLSALCLCRRAIRLSALCPRRAAQAKKAPLRMRSGELSVWF